jgi:hypothetical protein
MYYSTEGVGRLGGRGEEDLDIGYWKWVGEAGKMPVLPGSPFPDFRIIASLRNFRYNYPH